MSTSFLSPPLRKVVALAVFAVSIFAGGAAAADYVKGVARDEMRTITEIISDRLGAIDKRLERIERKLDRSDR